MCSVIATQQETYVMTTLDPYANRIEYKEMYCRKSEDGDDFVHWALFPSHMSNTEIYIYCNDNLGWPVKNPYEYDTYHRENPTIKRVNSRALIKQEGRYE